MNYWKIGTHNSGREYGTHASTFVEACNKLGLNWRDCYTIAIY